MVKPEEEKTTGAGVGLGGGGGGRSGAGGRGAAPEVTGSGCSSRRGGRGADAAVPGRMVLAESEIDSESASWSSCACARSSARLERKALRNLEERAESLPGAILRTL